MNGKEIQTRFLDRIKSTLPVHLAFVDEMAEVLGVTRDAAYRRISAKTLLTIDEISILCNHFKIPFDTDAFFDSHSVSFTYVKLYDKAENFKKWLTRLRDNVKYIADNETSEIIYAADDIPLWHHFVNPEFTCFKLFYWMKSILNEPRFADRKFDPALIDPELIQLALELANDYNRCQSTEIWTEDTLNSTLKQVEYFWESGFFNNAAEALRMCGYIEEELITLQSKAEKSSKLTDKKDGGRQNFKLYRSEVMIGNNSILATVGGAKIAYVSNNTFNFITTVSAGFVAENEAWLKNLERRSILISGVSEKQRNVFFKILRDKINIVREKIK